MCDTAISQLSTSPPPRTIIDGNSTLSESPCKRQRLSEIDKIHFAENLSDMIQLVLKNNEIVHIEKRVLTYYSNYFQCIFSSSFPDAKRNVHRIRLVSSHDLHILFTIPRAFEIGKAPEVSMQRAIDLLEPAAYLQMDIVLDYITDIICDNLKVDNIIRIFRLSLIYYTPLALRVWRMMIREFQAMFNSNEYLKLYESELLALLSDKDLNIKSKDEKSVVEQWIRHNSPLYKCRMSDFAKKNLKRQPAYDSTCYEVLRVRQPSTALIALGGWSSRGVAQQVEVFNMRSETWQKCDFNYDVPTIKRAYFGSEIVDEKLIVFGGFSGATQYQTTVLFDLITKKWTSGMNMHERRCYMTSTKVVNSDGSTQVYACGGMDGISRLKSCEIYNVATDMWTEIADMNYCRSDGAVATLGTNVMCAGGFDGRNFHSNAEVYDSVVDRWLPISRNMRTRRTGCSAISVMDQVCVVVGGFNGSKRLDSSEMYDLREGIWHAMPTMHCGRSNYGINFVDNHDIYVGGGFDGHSTTKENERLDLRSKRWQALPDMNEQKSALRLIQLANHPFLDELLNIPDDDGILETW